MDRFPPEIIEEFKRLAKGCKYKIITIIIFLLFTITLQYGCSPINKRLGLPDDHPIEQAAESFIEQQTGISILCARGDSVLQGGEESRPPYLLINIIV